MNPFLLLSKYMTRLQVKSELNYLKNLKNSDIHPSFKIGKNNYWDVSPEAKLQIAENVMINESNYITVKRNAKLKIGKNTYITRATISCIEEVEIGENCVLGEGMKIFDHNHNYTVNPFSVSKTEFNTAKITMGDNCWTGANVIILKGVTIGDNCILGAGCVIHKDVPPNSIIINKQQHLVKEIG
jgi:acetyltransferase-like isoleucine patch superfamily enzyme